MTPELPPIAPPRERLDWQNSKRPSKITIPERAHPLAKLLFAEMQRQGVTYAELEHRSGVLVSTFKAYRTDNSPGMTTIAAALGALGWALVPVPRMERVPQSIRDGLDALNAEWAGAEPLLHQLLASACLAPILVGGAQPARTIDVTPTSVRTKRKAKGPLPGQIALFSETVQ